MARLLILVGGLIAIAGVLAGFAFDLISLEGSFGWAGVAAGVVLAPLTVMLEPWRALFSSADPVWINLVVTYGGVFAGAGLYGFGHWLLLRADASSSPIAGPEQAGS